MAERGMIKILIVDDEKSICDLIDMNLSAVGYQCKSIQDGLEAIDLIGTSGCDAAGGGWVRYYGVHQTSEDPGNFHHGQA